MVVRRPSSLFTKSTSSSSQHSVSSSRSTSSQRTRSWDIEDKDDMSTEDHASPRPLTVTIPHATGPYCQRRPGLKEILTNTAPAPWTLAAFMAYLSANLCLENLEFTMDAGRYQKHYAKMMAKAGPDGNPPKKDSEYVRLLWVRLIDAYIAPNGSREVNLPSSVRDPILNAATSPMPPAPATLDPAVSKTYELMEESVLQPFLNSLCPQTSAAHSASTSWQERSHFRESMSAHAQTEHDSMLHRQRKNPSPPVAPPPLSHSSSEPSQASGNTSNVGNRLSTTISLTKGRFATGKSSSSGSGLSTTLSNTSDGSLGKLGWTSSGQAMTDDSGSTSSPTNEGPVTPPMSPPVSELSSSLPQSSKHNRDSGMWKKLGRLSGIKHTKKKSSSFDEQHR